MSLNNFSLKGKVAVITGAAGLLGSQHINVVLQNEGIAILIDIDRKKLNLCIKKYNYFLKKKKLLIFNSDITKESSIKVILKKIIKDYSKVDILINNAAVDYKLDKDHKKIIKKTRLETFDLNIWKKDINVGLTGALICTKIFGQQMVKQGGGVILNIASDLSFISPDHRLYNKSDDDLKRKVVKPISYSVVKHGVVGLTKYTANYWARRNIRCNAIAPGGIDNNQPVKFKNKIAKLIPMGRMAGRNEYESSILYLISDASSYMNGAVLVVDGGRTVI